MPRCSATSCRNMGSHTFPKDPNLRTLWEKATNKENFKASKHSRLCSDHFQPSDYVELCLSTGTSPFHRYLKKTAVPSIFFCKNQQSTMGASESATKAASRQQISRHLQKGVVPSIFPWTKQLSVSDATQPQKVSCTSTKNNVLKKAPVSPQNDPKEKEEESNSSEMSNFLRNKSVRLRNKKAFLLNRRCSVPHCNTRPTNEISLYPCPNNAAVRNEWAEALRVSYQYVKNMVACSLHFTKLDFIQSKNSERVLKHNAVPSRNLQTRKKVMVPVKHKLLKKGSSKAFDRQRTMTDTVAQTKEAAKDEVNRECRACLKKLDDKKSCCNVFQAWAPPWDGMEATIAEDLAKLANVEISLTDRHSKVLCAPCYQRLLDAATFASGVRNCDLLLRMRFTADFDMEKVWPKPIQVDKNINGSVFSNPMDIEIKQEILTDDEYTVKRSDNPYVDTELANLDIKIEPEEIVEPPPLNIIINSTISLDPLNSENKYMKNGSELHQETQYLQMEVKQEPTSESEQEIEMIPDLPLECLLCTKSFNSVTGLKAHVIAQHSYKTVKRKADGSVSPEKKRCDLHQCAICKRTFQTSTDLMVHETCHNKHVCYGCNEKFDSFELLTRHRKRCKASIANSVQKLKTLEDVKRPLPEEKLGHVEQELKKLEPETKYRHDEDIDMKELEPINKDVEMKELDNEQKEENSQENQVESAIENVENDKNIESEKNTLDSVVMKEGHDDKKLESVIEAEVKEKQLENVIQEEENVIEELDNAKKTENVIEELDNAKKTENVIEELDNAKKTENVIEEFDIDKNTESVNEEYDIVKKIESVIEEYDMDKKIKSVIEEFDLDGKSKSVVEEFDLDEKSKSVVEEFDLDDKSKSVVEEFDLDDKSKSVVEEFDLDEKSKSVVEELDNAQRSENVIEEFNIDNKAKTVVEELGNDNLTGGIIEGIDTDNKSENVIEELDNDKTMGSFVVEQDNDKKLENVIKELDTNKKSESAVEEMDTDERSDHVIEESDNSKMFENAIKQLNNEINRQSVIEDIVSDSKTVENEKIVVTKQKNMESENIEDPDNNMNLNIEIQSTHNETEPTLSDACTPVETLDDCT